MKNELTSRVAKVWLGDDGIARIIHVPKAELTLAGAQETMAAYKKLYKGKRLPLFVDTREMKSMAREARLYYASAEAQAVASAVALIIDTPVSRVLGNFYLGLNKPLLPTRLFSSEDEALEWLKGYVE